MKADLLRNASDQSDGDGHLGKTLGWYQQVKADLQRILEGSVRPEADEAINLVAQQEKMVEDLQRLLEKSTQAVEDLAAAL